MKKIISYPLLLSKILVISCVFFMSGLSSGASAQEVKINCHNTSEIKEEVQKNKKCTNCKKKGETEKETIYQEQTIQTQNFAKKISKYVLLFTKEVPFNTLKTKTQTSNSPPELCQKINTQKSPIKNKTILIL